MKKKLKYLFLLFLGMFILAFSFGCDKKTDATQEIKYTVKYNCAEETKSVEIKRDELASPSYFTSDKYEIDSWYTDSNYNNEFDFNTPIKGNTTLYAKYTDKTKFEALDDGTYKLLGNDEVDDDAKVYTIPSTYNGKNITVIGKNSLYIKKELDEIIIPNTITKIETGAFSHVICKKIVIPDSVTEIEGDLFNLSIEEVVFGSGIKKLPNLILAYSEKLKSVTIKEGVEEIGEEAFYDCSSLTNVTLPKSLKMIGNAAFRKCISLEEIEIPSGVDVIDDCAFFGCSNLKNIKLNEGLKEIGAYAFYDCRSLTEFSLPNSVEVIENYAFEKANINHLILGNNAGALCGYFGDSVTKITLNDDAKNIVFKSCSRNLKTLIIGKNVESIKTNYSFEIYKLVEVYNIADIDLEDSSIVDYSLFKNVKCVHKSLEEESAITNVNGYEFVYGDGKYTLFNYIGNEENLVLPEAINNSSYEIGKYAFVDICKNNISKYGLISYSVGKSNIESVIIPENVTKIGELAFYSSDKLLEVTINSKELEIGNLAFQRCYNLNKLILNSNITKIDNSFDECYKLFEIYNNSNLELECGSKGNGSVALYAKVIHNSLDDESNYFVENNCLFLKDNDNNHYLVYYYMPNDSNEIYLPDYANGNPYSIVDECFNGIECEGIRIPNTILGIAKNIGLSINAKTNADGYGKYLGNEDNPYLVLYEYNKDYAGDNTLDINENTKFIIADNLLRYNRLLLPKNVIKNPLIAKSNDWYYFTSLGVNETKKGNWWYYDNDGNTMEIIIE